MKKITGVFYDESEITLGTGHTQKIQKIKNYCQGEQLNEEKVKLTFLGNEGQPTGIVMEIAYDEFLKKYTLDPNYRVKTKEESERDRHIAIAEKHRSRGEPYTAEMEYSSALKIDPESIRANFGIGTLYMEMGDTSRAKDVFKKLSEIEAIFEEENKHIFNEFGIELRKANMIDEALANYQKAITISPQDEHLHFNVARLFYEKKDGDNALEWLQKSLAINPHFRDAQQFESLILKEMKEQGITPNARKAQVKEAPDAEQSLDTKEDSPDAGADKQTSAVAKKSVPPQKQTIKR